MIFPVTCLCGFVNVQLIVFTWGPLFQAVLSRAALLMPCADPGRAQPWQRLEGHSIGKGFKESPSHPIPASLCEMGVFSFLLLCKVYLIFFSLIKSFSLPNCQNLSLHLQLQENKNHWLRNPLQLPIVNRSAEPIADSSQILCLLLPHIKLAMSKRFTH